MVRAVMPVPTITRWGGEELQGWDQLVSTSICSYESSPHDLGSWDLRWSR